MTPVPPVALPPKARAILYYITAIVGIGLGATQSALLALDKGQPDWLTIALVVYPFVAAAFGTVAASNTEVPAKADE